MVRLCDLCGLFGGAAFHSSISGLKPGQESVWRKAATDIGTCRAFARLNMSEKEGSSSDSPAGLFVKAQERRD